MTNEETIELIQKLVPKVMALEFGCEVEEKPAFGSGMKNDTFNGGKVFTIICKDNSGNWLYLTDGGFGREKEDKILSWHTILGKPITLAVIFQAFENNNTEVELSIFANKILIGHYEKPNQEGYYTKCYWNLSKDNLNDQSEETKTFINNLLK